MSPRIVLCVLIIALLLSLALSLLLLRAGRRYERAYNATRIDPLQLGAFDGTSVAPPEPATTRVVLFGDSRAAQWPTPQQPGFEYINRGIDGQTSAQALLRFDAHVPPLRPDIVVVQVGVNDLMSLHLFPNERAQIIANCQANIAALVQKAQALGATVILTTVFPLGDPTLLEQLTAPPDTAAVEEVNAAIGRLAGPRVRVFDTRPVLADDRGRVRRAYQADTWHLNAAGYAALNVELEKVVSSQ